MAMAAMAVNEEGEEEQEHSGTAQAVRVPAAKVAADVAEDV
jgi:hypothetical protein